MVCSVSQGRLKKLFRKLGLQTSPPLPAQLLYPVEVRRRDYASEAIRRHGGLEVFDAPNAVAINQARIANLASMGLPLARKRVLDIGCGVGHLGTRLSEMGSNVV